MHRTPSALARTVLVVVVASGVAAASRFAVAQPANAAAATSTPSPAPSPSPSAAPTTAAYRFVYKPTPPPTTQSTPFPGPNPPQIAEIDLSDATLVTPGTIRVRVLTSDAVASVVAETFGNTFAIPKKEPGLFTFEGYVGDVPAYVKNRTYDVTFTASTSDGRNAAVTLPLTLR